MKNISYAGILCGVMLGFGQMAHANPSVQTQLLNAQQRYEKAQNDTFKSQTILEEAKTKQQAAAQRLAAVQNELAYADQSLAAADKDAQAKAAQQAEALAALKEAWKNQESVAP